MQRTVAQRATASEVGGLLLRPEHAKALLALDALVGVLVIRREPCRMCRERWLLLVIFAALLSGGLEGVDPLPVLVEEVAQLHPWPAELGRSQGGPDAGGCS